MSNWRTGKDWQIPAAVTPSPTLFPAQSLSGVTLPHFILYPLSVLPLQAYFSTPFSQRCALLFQNLTFQEVRAKCYTFWTTALQK